MPRVNIYLSDEIKERLAEYREREGYQLIMLGYIIDGNVDTLRPHIEEIKSLIGKMAKNSGFARVDLFGTKFTMEADFYSNLL